jgi:hypothetical protein
MKNLHKLVVATAFFAGLGSANATTIDFQSYVDGTAISSLGGITFSTYGGPGPGGTPVIGLSSFAPGGLVNSTVTSSYNNYPTSAILDFNFNAPASNVSFYFNNQGDNGGTFYSAYNAGGTLIETGLINTDQGGVSIVLSASGIKDLTFNNNTGGSSSWVFDVPSITFTPGSAVPEPSTWAMMLVGFAALGFASYRGRRSATAVA